MCLLIVGPLVALFIFTVQCVKMNSHSFDCLADVLANYCRFMLLIILFCGRSMGDLLSIGTEWVKE